MPEQQYYVRMQDFVYGPFTALELKKRGASGDFDQEAEVSNNSENWIHASRIPGWPDQIKISAPAAPNPPTNSSASKNPSSPVTQNQTEDSELGIELHSPIQNSHYAATSHSGIEQSSPGTDIRTQHPKNPSSLSENKAGQSHSRSNPAEVQRTKGDNSGPNQYAVPSQSSDSAGNGADNSADVSSHNSEDRSKASAVSRLKQSAHQVSSGVMNAASRSGGYVHQVWDKYTNEDPSAPQEEETPEHLIQDLDIFVSYRRQGGSEVARFVVDRLKRNGYTVFLDVQNLAQGEWAVELEQRIEKCSDFVPIITKDFFARCTNPEDVVRKEIASALEKGKNIVPLIATENPFPPELPEDIQDITKKNGVRYVYEYPEQMFNKLFGMLVSGRGGPQRLAEEKKPRRVVTIIGMLLAVVTGMQGVRYSQLITLTNSLQSLLEIFTGSLTYVAFTMFLVALPVFFIYTVIAAIKNIKPHKHYGGRDWGIFWLIYTSAISFLTLVSSTLASVALNWLLVDKESKYNAPSWLYCICVGVSLFVAYTATKVMIKFRLWNRLGQITTAFTR